MTEWVFNIIQKLQTEDPNANVLFYFYIYDGKRCMEIDVFFKEKCETFNNLLDADKWADNQLTITVDSLLEKGGI